MNKKERSALEIAKDTQKAMRYIKPKITFLKKVKGYNEVSFTKVLEEASNAFGLSTNHLRNVYLARK